MIIKKKIYNDIIKIGKNKLNNYFVFNFYLNWIHAVFYNFNKSYLFKISKIIYWYLWYLDYMSNKILGSINTKQIFILPNFYIFHLSNNL